jgi:arylsulfatase A-like enzyme
VPPNILLIMTDDQGLARTTTRRVFNIASSGLSTNGRRGWASSTPFKGTKQVASHFGGTRQGLAISWPSHIKDVGGIRTQFHHVIDIVPTILEVTGIKTPEQVDGIKQKPIEGVSMAYTFDSANADAPSKHDTQYFEMVGNRAIYHDGWIASTTHPAAPWLLATGKMPDVNDYHWELYHLTEDYSQYSDLAAKNPHKLKELQALFLTEAPNTTCFPWITQVLCACVTDTCEPFTVFVRLVC